MKTVVLFGNFQLPEGSALATRVVALAKLIGACGYDVVMCGIDYNDCMMTSGTYEDVPYELIPFGLSNYKLLKRKKRLCILKERIDAWFRSFSKDHVIYAVLYCGGGQGLVSFVIDYCKLHNYKLIYNFVEWFGISRFSGLLAPFQYLNYLYDFYCQYPRIKNVIGISSLLTDYCKKKGCHTIRIPTITDVSMYQTDTTACNMDSTVIAYAGNMGKKDAVINVVKAIALLQEDLRKRLKCVLYGVTQKELLKCCGHNAEVMKCIGKEIVCKGVVPYRDVRKELLKCDFTILLRKSTRRSNAGFPTKVGESMAAGVPVIANLTSDIGLYLHDGVEGLVCSDEKPETCMQVIAKALTMTTNEKREMRLNARKQAEKSFDCFAYVGEMSLFLREII